MNTMDRAAYLARIDQVNREGTYQPNWDSLAQYTVPAWYADMKFGIFLHWGVFSVPAFGSEWYSRNMYIQGSPEFEHHVETYGPHKQFGYKDFIPMFTMEKFDPQSWASLFREAGAEYVVPVAEHHDGFQLYASELSQWNAAEMGPHRDVLGDLLNATDAVGLTRGVSSHRVEHWWFMGHGREFDSDIHEPMKLGDFYWPAQPEPQHMDLFSKPTPSEEFLTDWLLRCCELVDRYHPRMVYFDWWIRHESVLPYLQRFAAYYYNRAESWGGGVIFYKHDAFAFGCAVPDVERGQFAEAKPFPWQSDTAVARNSWGYTEGNVYKEPREVLWDLIDVVSKNGRLLLNVGPKSDGTIGAEDARILKAIGAWLRVNGEAIYHSHVWRVAQEGPTRVKEGQFTDSVAKSYTGEDFRFTCRGKAIYAIAMACPEDGVLRIRSLARWDGHRPAPFQGMIEDVTVLGMEQKPAWRWEDEALIVPVGDRRNDLPFVVKVTVR